MYPYEDSEYPGCAVELNTELQQAQLELLSAHCATHQLRLHYSSDDLARFGRRELLRKSAQAASELNEFYTAIEKRIPLARVSDPAPPTPEQIEQAVQWLVDYLEEQREKYMPVAIPLSRQRKALLWPYFAPDLLEEVRVMDLRGACVEIPAFYANVRALGFEPPEITHMGSLTFIDVVVFNQQLTERALFHALVHSVQIKILGLRRYAELWVQSFIRTKAHFTVPLEVHAFSLASKFLRPAERFSVEDHVLRWVTDGRY